MRVELISARKFNDVCLSRHMSNGQNTAPSLGAHARMRNPTHVSTAVAAVLVVVYLCLSAFDFVSVCTPEYIHIFHVFSKPNC
jgi:hypothetical protein